MCSNCGHDGLDHVTTYRNSIPTPWCLACAKEVKPTEGLDHEWDVAECSYKEAFDYTSYLRGRSYL